MSDKPTNNDKKPAVSKDNNNNPSNHTANPSDEHPSLASRIQSSASGLARNALYGSGPSADTAQLLAGGGSKPGASSSSRPSAFAAAQQYQESSGPSSASAASSRDPAPAQSFRSPSSTAQQQQQQGGFTLPALTEDEFQRSYGDPFPDQDVTSSSSKGKEKAFPLHHPHPEQTPAPPAQHQQPPDGADVLTLLTSPTFDPEFPPTEHEPFEPIETDLSSTLTDAERATLDSFRRQQPQHQQPSTSTQTTTTRTPLTQHSLIPDIGSFLDSVPASTQSDATQLRDAVLSGLPGAADWVALEEQYQDEVWGYLRPTLEAAAREMEERAAGREEGGKEDGPAVRRLKMVLMHMRG